MKLKITLVLLTTILTFSCVKIKDYTGVYKSTDSEIELKILQDKESSDSIRFLFDLKSDYEWSNYSGIAKLNSDSAEFLTNDKHRLTIIFLGDSVVVKEQILEDIYEYPIYFHSGTYKLINKVLTSSDKSLIYKTNDERQNDLLKMTRLADSVYSLNNSNENISDEDRINNFEISSFGYHGFYKGIDSTVYGKYERMFYAIELSILNNTKYKLRKLEIRGDVWYNSGICSGMSGTYFSQDNDLWLPNSVLEVKLVLIATQDGLGRYLNKSNFEHTPEEVKLRINIKANNVDQDFDETIMTYNILNDWKTYQEELGLRK